MKIEISEETGYLIILLASVLVITMMKPEEVSNFFKWFTAGIDPAKSIRVGILILVAILAWRRFQR